MVVDKPPLDLRFLNIFILPTLTKRYSSNWSELVSKIYSGVFTRNQNHHSVITLVKTPLFSPVTPIKLYLVEIIKHFFKSKKQSRLNITEYLPKSENFYRIPYFFVKPWNKKLSNSRTKNCKITKWFSVKLSNKNLQKHEIKKHLQLFICKFNHL